MSVATNFFLLSWRVKWKSQQNRRQTHTRQPVRSEPESEHRERRSEQGSQADDRTWRQAEPAGRTGGKDEKRGGEFFLYRARPDAQVQGQEMVPVVKCLNIFITQKKCWFCTVFRTREVIFIVNR